MLKISKHWVTFGEIVLIIFLVSIAIKAFKKVKTISNKGLNYLKTFEGFRPKMYLDKGGLPTIGYGTLIDTDAEKYLLTKTITENEASELMRKDLQKFTDAILNNVTRDLTQSELDALIIFTYNVGETAFKNSTLLKKINSNAPANEIVKEFLKWNKIKGTVNNVLTNRRKKEAELFTA